MNYPTQCPECSGTGEIEINGQICDCPVCDGAGKIDDEDDFTGEE